MFQIINKHHHNVAPGFQIVNKHNHNLAYKIQLSWAADHIMIKHQWFKVDTYHTISHLQIVGSPLERCLSRQIIIYYFDELLSNGEDRSLRWWLLYWCSHRPLRHITWCIFARSENNSVIRSSCQVIIAIINIISVFRPSCKVIIIKTVIISLGRHLYKETHCVLGMPK